MRLSKKTYREIAETLGRPKRFEDIRNIGDAFPASRSGQSRIWRFELPLLIDWDAEQLIPNDTLQLLLDNLSCVWGAIFFYHDGDVPHGAAIAVFDADDAVWVAMQFGNRARLL